MCGKLRRPILLKGYDSLLSPQLPLPTSVQLGSFQLSQIAEAFYNESNKNEAVGNLHLSGCRGAFVCGLGETVTLDTPSSQRLSSRIHSLPGVIFPSTPESQLTGSGSLSLGNFFLDLLKATPPQMHNVPLAGNPLLPEQSSTGDSQEWSSTGDSQECLHQRPLSWGSL